MNMLKTITVPKKLDKILEDKTDKRIRKRILKIYEALLYKRDLKKGFFAVPSTYLKKVNSRYKETINLFLEYGIIDYRKNVEYTQEDLFDDHKIIRKKYNKDKGICMEYRFLIDIKQGRDMEIEIDVENLYKDKRWYNITKSSLNELGLEPRIKRDNFSRRLHTNVTGDMALKAGEVDIKSYKDYCKGYYTIDGVTSQPRILYLWLKQMGIYDKNLFDIFENDLDFYDYLIDNIKTITTRDMAKMLFLEFINGKGYTKVGDEEVEDILIMNRLFPITNTMIKNYKKDDYKNFCRMIQHKESKIWIDDLLNNIPTDFGLSVHDSLIVKEEDVTKVLNYCKAKYPDLKFKEEKIK